MRKLSLFTMLFLSINIAYSQNEYFKKHNFLFNIDINNNGYFTKEYYAKSTPQNNPDMQQIYKFPLETEYPGGYKLPEYGLNAGISYQYFLFKGLNFTTSIHYTARSYSETRSEDSTRIYYLYADSIKEILPFYEASAPIYESRISRCVELHFSIGYQYKRLNIT